MNGILRSWQWRPEVYLNSSTNKIVKNGTLALLKVNPLCWALNYQQTNGCNINP